MLVTEPLCWRLFSLCWWFSQCIKSVTNILNWSPKSQTCHQHIWSPTSVTNIDVTVHGDSDLYNNQVYGAMGFSVRYVLFGLILISQLEGSTIVCTDSGLYNSSISQSFTIEILNTDFLTKFWRYYLYSICRLDGPGPTWSSISQSFNIEILNTDFLTKFWRYYLQSLQRLSTRVCKYFRPFESLHRLSFWKS